MLFSNPSSLCSLPPFPRIPCPLSCPCLSSCLYVPLLLFYPPPPLCIFNPPPLCLVFPPSGVPMTIRGTAVKTPSSPNSTVCPFALVCLLPTEMLHATSEGLDGGRVPECVCARVCACARKCELACLCVRPFPSLAPLLPLWCSASK